MKTTKKTRTSIRKQPTLNQALLMRFAMYDIAHWSAEGKGLSNLLHKLGADPSEPFDIDNDTVTLTFSKILPTFLILKLGTAVEQAVNTLWSRRFPEIDAKRLRNEDKLAVIAKLHNVDAAPLQELWKLRNTCAHNVDVMTTVEEFEKHFSNAYEFIKRFKTERNTPRRNPYIPARIRNNKARRDK